ncbi:hypothetical protein FOZ61_008977, partial [Perkinsus olseni]
MRATFQLVSLFDLVISSVSPSPSPGHDLEFYKEIRYTWSLLEGPTSYTAKGKCPVTEYTWDFFFNYLTEHGVKNFVLGGYNVQQSKVHPVYYPHWDKTAFKALKERVKARGGRILADLGIYDDEPFNFDKTTFLESVTKFIKDFPVDGFRLGVNPAGSARAQSLKKILEAFRSFEGYYLREIAALASLAFSGKTRRDILKLSVTMRVMFTNNNWQVVKDDGLGNIADTHFVVIWPWSKDDIPVFNTNNFAEGIIKNVISAGVRPNTIVLVVSDGHLVTLTAKVSSTGWTTGYSSVIFDDKGDPKGDGSVEVDPKDPAIRAYFFSQPRAIEKIGLAKKRGLHGIALQQSV